MCSDMIAPRSDISPEHLNIVDQSAPIDVLHVDDDESFVELAETFLERASSQLVVHTETSVRDGLERLAEEEIDCVVSDYDMPGRDGLEFLDAVREEYDDLPFILFTGKGNEEIASEAISAGVTEYLQKGSGTDQYTVLANRIEHAVGKRRAEREVYRGFQAMESAREGIGLIDDDGTYQYANQAYADIYGCDPEGIVGNHWEELYPDDEVERFRDEILPELEEQGFWTGESVGMTKDGERVPETVTLTDIDDGGHVCIVRDISERKRRERELRREQQFLETTLDALEDVFYVFDTDMEFIRWNDRLEAVTGYDAHEIAEMSPLSFFDDDVGAIQEAIAKTVEDREQVTVEATLVTADGDRRPYEFTGSPVEDDGELVAICGIGRDRTAHRERADLHERLMEMSPAPTLVIGADGAIRYCNTAVADFLDAPDRDAVVGEPALEYIHPDDRDAVGDRLDRILSDHVENEPLEERIVGFDGETRSAVVASSPVTFDGDPAAQVVLNDVTAEREQRRAVEQKTEQIELLSSVLSHDMRGPVSVAIGRLQLARETGEQAHIEQAEAALERTQELIEDVTELLQDGDIVNEVEPLELAQVVADVEETFGTDRLTIRVADSTEIAADYYAAKRLFENLFSNAVEHASMSHDSQARRDAVERGGPETTVEVGTLDDRAGFYVADDGSGIPPEEREQVFEPGYTTKESGSGFGLVSIQQIVQAHGWTIDVAESDAGGTRFEISGVERP